VTVNIMYSNANDGYVQSFDATYANSRNGTGSSVTVELAGGGYWGQNANSGYNSLQTFLEFSYTATAADMVTAAWYEMCVGSNLSTSVARNMEVSAFDWGGTITSADWRNATALAALTRYATVTSAQSAASVTVLRGGGDALVNALASSATHRVVVASSRTRAGNTPTSDEGSYFFTSETGPGTVYDPALVVLSVTRHTLTRVIGACAHLSDGSEAYLESNGSATPTITLKTYDGTTTTTVATLNTGSASATQFATPASLQGLTLCVDPSDNIYVVGASGFLTGTITAQAWQKVSGSYVQRTALNATMPAYSGGVLNNFASAYLSTSGNYVMVYGSHTASTGSSTQTFYALLSATVLLAGSGTLAVSTASPAIGPVFVTSSDLVDYPNPTGTGLDIATYTAQYVSVLTYGTNDQTAAADVTVASGTTNAAPMNTSRITISQNPNSRARVVPIPSQNARAEIAAGQVVVRNFSNSVIASVDLTTVASFPNNVADLATWDAIYDPASNKIWVYYLDTANNRRLMRTAVSLTTLAGTNEEIQISAAVGGVGTSNLAIRLPRGAVNERRLRIAVANNASGTLSTVYVADTLNVAPDAPTLNAVSGFDAGTSKAFTWTSSDVNTTDAQTAYQLQIINVSTSATAFDTGKVTSGTSSFTLPASSISNSGSYQWKVRTYDKSDTVGPYSANSAFTTAAGGTVTITTPATDNAAGINTANVPITWSVSGATQAQYRLRVVRTSDGVQMSDTGFVVSAATTANAMGLATGVEYRVEVTIKDGGGVSSNIGTRLVTSNFSSPTAPVVTLSQGSTYVLVSVSNPTPPGDQPEVSVNALYRRLTGGSDTSWVQIASLPYNGVYRDYAVAAGVSYDYQVKGSS
jgi:hypothetical protein